MSFPNRENVLVDREGQAHLVQRFHLGTASDSQHTPVGETIENAQRAARAVGKVLNGSETGPMLLLATSSTASSCSCYTQLPAPSVLVTGDSSRTAESGSSSQCMRSNVCTLALLKYSTCSAAAEVRSSHGAMSTPGLRDGPRTSNACATSHHTVAPVRSYLALSSISTGPAAGCAPRRSHVGLCLLCSPSLFIYTSSACWISSPTPAVLPAVYTAGCCFLSFSDALSTCRSARTDASTPIHSDGARL